MPEKHAKSPSIANFARSGLGFTPELDDKLSSHRQSQIGALGWMVGLGRVDITAEASEPSSFPALPCEGHVRAVFWTHLRLKRRNSSLATRGASQPEIGEEEFQQRNWDNFCDKVGEQFPPAMSEPPGPKVVMRAHAGADHARDGAGRSSQDGLTVCANEATIAWQIWN